MGRADLLTLADRDLEDDPFSVLFTLAALLPFDLGAAGVAGTLTSAGASATDSAAAATARLCSALRVFTVLTCFQPK